jgi:hypothetical protein
MKKPSWFFWAFAGLVWLVMSLPFSGYSPLSLLYIPDSPPRSSDEMWKLLQNITFAANFSILSLIMLYGLNRGWHLDDRYPSWFQRFNLQAKLKTLLESKTVFLGANIVLTLIGLVSTIFLFLHGRILGRSLGYW